MDFLGFEMLRSRWVPSNFHAFAKCVCNIEFEALFLFVDGQGLFQIRMGTGQAESRA